MSPPAAGRPLLGSALVGATVGPITQTIDARWLMAYAAGLGETDARYYDTSAPAGPVAHPLFAVCYEWPVAVALRSRIIDETTAPLGVHFIHDLAIHRPPRAADRLTTTARVESVRPHRAGTIVLVRYDTTDDTGAMVTTTRHGSLYRGVPLAEEPSVGVRPDRADDARPSHRAEPAIPRWQDTVDIAANAAHVYTECARIWNPIHTDVAVARAAGLPGIILHGTATLALAVSRVVARDVDGDPAAVRRVTARFTGMVTLPSVVTVRGWAGAPLAFDAVDGGGRPVLADGRLER